VEDLCGTFDLPFCPEYTNLKQRYDQINQQQAPVMNNAEIGQWQDKSAVSKVDSNRLHEDVEKCDFDCPKRQRDIDNKELKEQRAHSIDLEQCQDSSLSPKCQQDIDNEELKQQMRTALDYTKRQQDIDSDETRTRPIDLEQCQDSSLPPVEALQISVSLTAKHHWETSVKSALCGSSETSVKSNFDLAAETLPSKDSVSTHSDVVDLCQVEPMLEKGSIEAQVSGKTSEDRAIEDKDVFEFGYVSKEHAVEEKVVQEPPRPVIMQDAKHYDCHEDMDHQRKGGIISATFSPESLSESLAIAGVEDPPQKTTVPQVKNTGIKPRDRNALTERQRDWKKARKSASKAQKSAIDMFPMKTSHPATKPSRYWDYEWILPWLLPSKRPYSQRSEYLLFIGCS